MITWTHPRAQHADRPAGRGLAAQRGETLIELMFTVVLLGVGFVTIMSAIFTATNVSDANQERTKASIAVQAFAEALMQPADDPPASPPSNWYPQQAYRYVACATPADYQTYLNGFAATALPSGYTATIEQIRYLGDYDGDPPVPLFTPAGDQAAATAQCVSDYRTSTSVTDISGGSATMYLDKGIQELTVKIDSGARRKRSIDTLVFLKRDQRCPGTYQNADLGPC